MFFSRTWIDGSRFLPVLGNSILNLWSRTLCNLTCRRSLIRFICVVTSEDLMVHYFSLMLELKFTEFVILKNKYNCLFYISGLFLCSGVVCEVSWFRNRSGGFFKRKQMVVGARKIIKRKFWVQDRKISVSGGMDQHPNLGWHLGWDLLIHPPDIFLSGTQSGARFYYYFTRDMVSEMDYI